MSSDEERRAREYRRSQRERARADRMPLPPQRSRLQSFTWPLMPGEVLVILLVLGLAVAGALVFG